MRQAAGRRAGAVAARTSPRPGEPLEAAVAVRTAFLSIRDSAGLSTGIGVCGPVFLRSCRETRVQVALGADVGVCVARRRCRPPVTGHRPATPLLRRETRSRRSGAWVPLFRSPHTPASRSPRPGAENDGGARRVGGTTQGPGAGPWVGPSRGLPRGRVRSSRTGAGRLPSDRPGRASVVVSQVGATRRGSGRPQTTPSASSGPALRSSNHRHTVRTVRILLVHQADPLSTVKVARPALRSSLKGGWVGVRGRGVRSPGGTSSSEREFFPVAKIGQRAPSSS